MEGVIALIIISWLMTKFGKNAQKKKAAAFSTVKNRLAREQQAARQTTMESIRAEESGEGESLYTPPPEYVGSMMADSNEGEDLCDPTLAHDRPERPDPQSVYANEIGSEPLLDFSPKAIYQGVVMSEILARRKGTTWRN